MSEYKGKVFRQGDLEALVLSDTNYAPYGLTGGYPAIVVNRLTGLREFPLLGSYSDRRYSLIVPHDGWQEQAYMGPVRGDITGVMGVADACLVIYPDGDTAQGTVCPCCGQTVQITCSCETCECTTTVSLHGEVCDDCLSHSTWCDVCDENTDHDSSSHDFCDKCNDYADHTTDGHQSFCDKCNDWVTHETEEHDEVMGVEPDSDSDEDPGN